MRGALCPAGRGRAVLADHARCTRGPRVCDSHQDERGHGPVRTHFLPFWRHDKKDRDDEEAQLRAFYQGRSPTGGVSRPSPQLGLYEQFPHLEPPPAAKRQRADGLGSAAKRDGADGLDSAAVHSRLQPTPPSNHTCLPTPESASAHLVPGAVAAGTSESRPMRSVAAAALLHGRAQRSYQQRQQQQPTLVLTAVCQQQQQQQSPSAPGLRVSTGGSTAGGQALGLLARKDAKGRKGTTAAVASSSNGSIEQTGSSCYQPLSFAIAVHLGREALLSTSNEELTRLTLPRQVIR